ncbi:MAG: (Fe-S)-binding protein [Actinomycetia bacterium]|nr:(Fe-S)-binding protein [Actinomycetes bacterium]
MDLKLDADDLNKCVQCGLCLPFCPTFRVTGDESRSPRGRIALMRHVQNRDAPLTTDVLDAFSTCVQCRGCEPACPSSVPYGHLIEQTRQTLAAQGHITPWWQRIGLAALAQPRMLRIGSSALGVVQRLRLIPRRLGLPSALPIKRQPHTCSGDDVYLFTGCVMDAWQRQIHQASQVVLEAAGFGVVPSGDAAPCCGALHTHAGLGDQARRLAEKTMANLGGDRPILVDSAGCGAALKEYGHLLGTPKAARFSSRVYDIQEWLADHVGRLPPVSSPLDITVAVQDPCHLRNVQRVHQSTRVVLRPYVRDLVELDDDGLCCGAGGAYSVLEPELAGQIRDRKQSAIERTGADEVASANPGCSLHLGGAGVKTSHPMELIARSIRSAQGGE